MNVDLSDTLLNLPHLPGVYRFLDAASCVLYVGKAVDLKRRVSSYFQKSDLSPRIALMVKQIASIETTVTASEAEALILEHHLIKALAPKYNILFRDDKSYPYLMLSAHDFPRMAYYRGEMRGKHAYFGPYPNSNAVKMSIDVLQKLFQIRTCEDSVYSNRSRPCLLHQIGRCSAPCTQEISVEDYAANLDQARAFLRGETQVLLQTLEQAMLAAAERLEFEKAGQLRDKIQALAVVQSQQYVASKKLDLDADIIVAVIENGLICVNLAMVRGGRHLGDKPFFTMQKNWVLGDVLVLTAGADEKAQQERAALMAFMAQHYLQPNGLIPPLLIVSHPLDAALLTVLQQTAGRKIMAIHKVKGERRIWQTRALTNAQLAVTQRLATSVSEHNRLLALQALLQLPNAQRFECFDISHTLGEATVASCVVYDKERMQTAEYRRFNISSQVVAGDDCAAMAEALRRRYGQVDAERRLPDALLIDGGLGQVNTALATLSALGVAIPVVGIAKGEARKAGLETLILPYLKALERVSGESAVSFNVAPTSPALHLIQTIRDEAHRFAITGHRARRAKARISSSLEDIKGVGAKRRQQLLTRFGGLREIKAASVADLASIDGISVSLAQSIYDALH